MPLVSGDAFALPYYANVQDAYPSVTVVSGVVNGANFKYLIAGEAWEILVSVFYRLATDATATARDPLLRIRNQDNVEIERVYSFLAQNGSQTIDHSFDSTVGAGYSPEPTIARTPLVGYPIASGWTVEVGANNMQPGDTLSLIRLVTTKYPTSGQPQAEAPALPHPLIT